MMERLMIKDFIARCPTPSARARSPCRTITDMLRASCRRQWKFMWSGTRDGLPSRVQWLAGCIARRASTGASVMSDGANRREPLAPVKQIRAGLLSRRASGGIRPARRPYPVCRGPWSRAKIKLCSLSRAREPCPGKLKFRKRRCVVCRQWPFHRCHRARNRWQQYPRCEELRALWIARTWLS